MKTFTAFALGALVMLLAWAWPLTIQQWAGAMFWLVLLLVVVEPIRGMRRTR